jgi:class 3 adenylate cyclase
MSFHTVDEIDDALRAEEHLSVRKLYNIWEQRQPVVLVASKTSKNQGSVVENGANQIRWLQSDLGLVTEFIKQALKKEEFLLVCDAYGEAMSFWKTQDEADLGELLKLHSCYAAAKTRLGFTRDARMALEPLLDEQKFSRKEKARILLQMGDILREESHHSPALAARRAKAEKAQEFYRQALVLDSTLMEAQVLYVAMALIVSEKGSARRNEAEVMGRDLLALLEGHETAKGESIRSTWFKAVAYSVQGRTDEAAGQYARLHRFPEITTSQLAEIRYRAQFLAEGLGERKDFFKSAFPLLQLIVFTGHIPDLPGEPPRFPRESIPIVRQLLRQKLDEIGAREGMVSAAAGADLLFIEALRERPGARYHVILPWSRKEFYRTSVKPFDLDAAPVWAPLFEQALENSATVSELGQVYEPSDDVGWEFTQEVTAGLALVTARAARLDLQPMSLWDGHPGKGAGGTASFVEFWSHYLKQPPIVLELPPTAVTSRRSHRFGKGRSERDTMRQEVKSMLFADIVGYSKLTEKVIRDFVEVFMQRLSHLLAKSSHSPRCINTWGDGIYAVFDFAEDAGLFALELTQMIRDGEKEWLEKGLFYEEFDAMQGKMVSRPLNVRVGLHTGPVFAHYNPVLRQLGFTGSHVSRAARIEPVAASGEVYASEEFAAMAELGAQIKNSQNDGKGSCPEKSDGFVCEYAGSMALAKNYPGRFRIYRVIPHRVLAMEELAMAAHALYCEQLIRGGVTPGQAPSIRPWAELSEDFRHANRVQVADIPNKLYELGYELAPSHGFAPSEIKITSHQLEELAIREHDRWLAERTRQGWSYGPVRDNARKQHPCLIPWADLPEGEKQKDRDTVINLPELIEKAGFRVRKIVQTVGR